MGLAEGPGELHRKQSSFPGSGEGHSKSAAKAGFGLRQEEKMLEREWGQGETRQQTH